MRDAAFPKEISVRVILFHHVENAHLLGEAGATDLMSVTMQSHQGSVSIAAGA